MVKGRMEEVLFCKSTASSGLVQKWVNIMKSTVGLASAEVGPRGFFPTLFSGQIASISLVLGLVPLFQSFGFGERHSCCNRCVFLDSLWCNGGLVWPLENECYS